MTDKRVPLCETKDDAAISLLPNPGLAEERRTTTYQAIDILSSSHETQERKTLSQSQPPLVSSSAQAVSNGVDTASLSVIYAVTLVSEGARGLLLPSTWPYFQSVGGTKEWLGVFVGVLSFGRMVITIPIGYLSDRYSSAYVFYITSTLQIIGHLLYIYWPSVRALIAARLIVGFGSSTISSCRAYIARAVPEHERTYHYAYLSALQFVGFAMLPCVGALLSFLPESKCMGVVLNGYTYPALVLAACCAATIAVTYFFYDAPPPLRGAHLQRTESSRKPHTAIDYWPISVCLLTNFIFRGLIAELETVTAPFLIEQFNLSYTQAGAYFSLFGMVGVAVYMFFKPLSRACSDRILIFLGLVIFVIGTMPLATPVIATVLPLSCYVTCIATLWGIAYPVGQTGTVSLFSKMLQGLPTGSLFGVFSATGSASRICFAVLAGAVWGLLGPEWMFSTIVFFAAFAMLIVSATWHKLWH